MWKNGALLVSTALLTAFVSGCGANTTSGNKTVTIKFWDRHPELQDILTKEVNDFQQKNPTIKVEFTEIPVTTQTQQYQAAVSGNSLPDVFTLSGYTTAQFVKLNQLHSLNSIFPKNVQDTFPAGVFTQGYSMIGDQVYMIPLYSPSHGTEVLYYNKDVLDKYGLSVPKAWNDVLSEGQDLYKKSGGKTYGLVMSVKQSDGELDAMASAIQPDVFGGMNYKTGHYEWNSAGYVQTLDFIKTLMANNALDPDSATMAKSEARAALASGQAAFEMDGDWGGGLYLGMGFKNFGVTKIPTNNGAPYYFGYVGPTPEGISISANTKYYEQASLFVQFLTDQLYSAMVDNGLDTAKQVKPQNPQYPQIPQIMDVIASTSKALPNFYAKNPATMDVVENFDSNKPKTKLSDILAGYLSGQIPSVSAALKDLSDQYNQVLDQSIQASGGKVTQKDFTFSNWTPFQSYTQSDYAQSK